MHHLTHRYIFATSRSFLFPLFLIGVRAKTSLLISLSYKNAKVISRKGSSHDIMENETKAIHKAWRLHFEESVFLFTHFFFNPLAINWVFNIFSFSFYFSMKTYLHETLSWPCFSTQKNTLFSNKLFNSPSLGLNLLECFIWGLIASISALIQLLFTIKLYPKITLLGFSLPPVPVLNQFRDPPVLFGCLNHTFACTFSPF